MGKDFSQGVLHTGLYDEGALRALSFAVGNIEAKGYVVSQKTGEWHWVAPTTVVARSLKTRAESFEVVRAPDGEVLVCWDGNPSHWVLSGIEHALLTAANLIRKYGHYQDDDPLFVTNAGILNDTANRPELILNERCSWNMTEKCFTKKQLKQFIDYKLIGLYFQTCGGIYYEKTDAAYVMTHPVTISSLERYAAELRKQEPNADQLTVSRNEALMRTVISWLDEMQDLLHKSSSLTGSLHPFWHRSLTVQKSLFHAIAADYKNAAVVGEQWRKWYMAKLSCETPKESEYELMVMSSIAEMLRSDRWRAFCEAAKILEENDYGFTPHVLISKYYAYKSFNVA